MVATGVTRTSTVRPAAPTCGGWRCSSPRGDHVSARRGRPGAGRAAHVEDERDAADTTGVPEDEEAVFR